MMLEGPAHYIVLMLIAGMMMGTVFDIYNTVTSTAQWLRILRSILDVIFFVAFAFVVYHISLATDNGRFRLYTFGLLAIGYALYRVFFHRAIVASAHLIIQIIHAVLMAIWKLLFTFVISPFLWITKLLKALFWGVYHIGCKIEDIICSTAAIISRLLLFPFKGYKELLLKVKMKVQPYEEGIWNRLSNLLKRHPRGA